uniref:Solute carrier organic anion transporter family member n=1 Tax=Culicoides sonorensis TaxID=179676 RepID=A0A336N235_CULSO
MNDLFFSVLNEMDFDEAGNKMSENQENDLKLSLVDHIPNESDTKCGFSSLQRLASKKTFILLQSIISAVVAASHAYTTGTISTMEKRFKIPSKYSGFIMTGHHISMMICSIVVNYIAAKGHRPRWMAFAIYLQVVYCFMMVLPHFMYGPGEDALSFDIVNNTISNTKRSNLCEINGDNNGCQSIDIDNFTPLVIFFIANFISGLAPINSLGTTYVDDNIKKSKVPYYLSFKYFLSMFGPTIGFALSSWVLKIYIDPTIEPSIKSSDPRWLGAYWIGWIILGFLCLITGFFIGLFPKTLPRAAVRRRQLIERVLAGKAKSSLLTPPEKPSIQDICATLKRLFTNKVFMFNNMAAVFYIFGYLPYWKFQTKYIEIQYLLSPSTASLVTGTVSFVFSAFGILISGLLIAILKPRAQSLALWNIFASILSIFGVISYALNGCVANDNLQIMENSLISDCNQACGCDYVKYSPICGLNGKTYISPCHAGCQSSTDLGDDDGKIIYNNCLCIDRNDTFAETIFNNEWEKFNTSSVNAIKGVCPVDCMPQFYMFLIVMCINKLLGGTEASANFLIGIRAVEERDKTVSLALLSTIASLCSLIPSPIVFGMIIDSTCVLWGKTCTSKGNCWLYDAGYLRYSMNFIAAGFVFIGTCFDVGTWYFSKNVQVFDSNEEKRDEVNENKDNIELSPIKCNEQ